MVLPNDKRLLDCLRSNDIPLDLVKITDDFWYAVENHQPISATCIDIDAASGREGAIKAMAFLEQTLEGNEVKKHGIITGALEIMENGRKHTHNYQPGKKVMMLVIKTSFAEYVSVVSIGKYARKSDVRSALENYSVDNLQTSKMGLKTARDLSDYFLPYFTRHSFNVTIGMQR